MKERETVLKTKYGLRLVLDPPIKDKEAQEWVELCEDLLGEAIDRQIYRLPFQDKTAELKQLKLTSRDAVLAGFPVAQNCWLNKDKGNLEIGLSQITKDGVNGVKFVMTPDFARTMASHLNRMAQEMDGDTGPLLKDRKGGQA